MDTLVGAGVFYGATTSEASALGGQHVYVAGAANSAKPPASLAPVPLVVRRQITAGRVPH